MADDDLRTVLERLSAKGRDALRRVLIRDQPDRDAIASELIHYGDEAGHDWADIIDALTMYPDQRRRVVRLLGSWRATVDLSQRLAPLCELVDVVHAGVVRIAPASEI